ncbi:XRE family transcriptional regulator, partial [Clostridium perfringens]
ITDHLQRGGSIGSYSEHIIDDRFANFLTDLGMYYIRKENIQKGSKYILGSLDLSYKINNVINIVRCCSTIEHIRHKLSHSDLQNYAAIMKEVYNRNEKKVNGTITHS